MNPAERESVRLALDQSGTPEDALGRKLIGTAATCAYFPPERPEPDICLLCGLEGWGCLCDPCEPTKPPTPRQLERGRDERLMRAERNG